MPALRSAAPAGEPVASLREVTVAYGAHVALDAVSLELPAGAIVGLIGPNGAGKTTLLRTLLGVLQPRAGTVRVAGDTGYMPQLGEAAWDFPLTVLEVALQGSYRRAGWLRRPRAADRAAARDALAAVGMAELAGRQVGKLSGGQRQRVLLARTLVQDAQLLLLDEPLSGADAATESAFLETLGRLRDDGRTIVVSTHDLGWSATQCDLLCLLSGRVVSFGPPERSLAPERLAEAYGGALIDVGGVRILAPEGHHAH
ncbi:MAG TPA: metal ABC transporter ATP-binding protein [Gaiellales bacterium]|jgi:ABC-type Mn2+/Zn2+ transport system ATPase subunit